MPRTEYDQLSPIARFQRNIAGMFRGLWTGSKYESGSQGIFHIGFNLLILVKSLFSNKPLLLASGSDNSPKKNASTYKKLHEKYDFTIRKPAKKLTAAPTQEPEEKSAAIEQLPSATNSPHSDPTPRHLARQPC